MIRLHVDVSEYIGLWFMSEVDESYCLSLGGWVEYIEYTCGKMCYKNDIVQPCQM